MGYQERDYYRDESGAASLWTSLPLTTKLIVLNVVLFLANVFFGHLTEYLALTPDALVKPLHWYQLLTAGFAHATPMHLFGNMLGLWFFGKPLEERFGKSEFLRFYLAAIFLGNLVWALRQYILVHQPMVEMNQFIVAQWPTLVGASGAITACIVLFCALNPRATILANMLFPVPAWLFGSCFVLMNVMAMRGVMARDIVSSIDPRIAYDVHLVGAAFALAYWQFGLNFRWIPSLDSFTRGSRSAKRWFKPQADLKVHAPEDDYESLDAEADRLLEKVHTEGEQSLTPRERQTLEKYSRRMRQKLR